MTTDDTRPEPERRRPDELVVDQLLGQFERTRQLLTGNPEAAAEQALARLGEERGVEARIAAGLALAQPLAHPERFPEAHRLTMRALEVLDREGSRNPTVPRLGPLSPLFEAVAEFVAEYVVQSYMQSVVGRLRSLYARREAQAAPGSEERRLLARARVDVERIAPGFGGGGVGAPLLVAAGAALPLLASAGNYLGAVDLSDGRILGGGLALLVLLFLVLSTVLLRGAATAHRRSRLVLRQPLAALWETIGVAGNPPEDDGVLIATVAIVLGALVWVVLPAVVGVALVVR